MRDGNIDLVLLTSDTESAQQYCLFLTSVSFISTETHRLREESNSRVTRGFAYVYAPLRKDILRTVKREFIPATRDFLVIYYLSADSNTMNFRQTENRAHKIVADSVCKTAICFRLIANIFFIMVYVLFCKTYEQRVISKVRLLLIAARDNN